MSEIEMTKAIVTNPSKNEFETMQRQCKLAVTSQLLPDEYQKGNANTQLAKAVVVAMKGRELGVPMMQAFSQIHVIKGKPTISAELMLALIYRAHPNAEINFIELSNTACKIKAKRPGGEFCEIEFTQKDATAAGLWGSATWKKYPRAMLRSRAVSEMARSLFPDAIMGCSYTPEELGGELDIEGEVVSTTPRDVGPQPPQAVEDPPQKEQPIDVSPKTQESPKEPQEQSQGPSTPQIKRLFAIAKGNNWSNEAIKMTMNDLVSKDSTKDLTPQEYEFLCNFFQDNEFKEPEENNDWANGPEPSFDDAPSLDEGGNIQ